MMKMTDNTGFRAASVERRRSLDAGAIERLVSAFVLVVVVAIIAFGWQHRNDMPIDPEHGWGYALGIIGGVLMLVLLAYPLRKRARTRSRAIGSVGLWFRMHMLLGLAGPLAILYHCRFSWGALNSAVALGAMIIVASSGLIGRFFYSRVHRGYSGRKLEMRQLKGEMDTVLTDLQGLGLSHEAIMQQLQPFETQAIAAGASFWSSAAAVINMGVKTRLAERQLRTLMPPTSATDGETGKLLAYYFHAVRRAAEFAFYDRLLRLWHLFHLPLFFLMIAAVILHIVAVHMY